MQRSSFHGTLDRGDDARGSGGRGVPAVLSVLLAILFFLVIAPIGLLLRLFGRDVLRLRRDPAAASYWIPRRPPGPAPDSMKSQF